MELVTGHQAGPHITAAQVSRFIQGITVMDDTTVYRLNEGNKCAITTTDLNLTIDTGEMVLHGFHVTNETAYDIGIDPVSNASNTRIDKIVLEITEDITTGIQNASVVVVQGTEAVSPVPPATPSTPSSPTELFLGVGVIAQITATDSTISVLTDLTELYAGSYVSKEDFDTGMSNVAPIENTNTASQPYSVGDHLIYNGILYKVDANIAQGATLVPNGNISLSPDVEAQIGALNSALTNIAPEAVTASTSQSTYSFLSPECWVCMKRGMTEVGLTIKPVATTGSSFVAVCTIPTKFGRPSAAVSVTAMSYDGGYTNEPPLQVKIDTNGNISCRSGTVNMRYNFYIVY